MDRPYTEEILTAATADGLTHSGVLVRPAGAPARPFAVVWLHGGFSNCLAGVPLARELAGRGYPCLAGNTRGRDYGFLAPRVGGSPLLAGAGWEKFSETALDVAAWVEAALSHGAQQAVLMGFSFGGLRAVAYLAGRTDPRVGGLVLHSTPVRHFRRRSLAELPPGERTPADLGLMRPEVLAQAQQMVAAGRGHELLPWGSLPALPVPISAQTCVDMAAGLDPFGVDTPAAEAPIARVRCPILALLGAAEPWVGSAGDLALIQRNAVAAARVEVQLVEGMSHEYLSAGHHAAVAAVVANWLATLPPTLGA